MAMKVADHNLRSAGDHLRGAGDHLRNAGVDLSCPNLSLIGNSVFVGASVVTGHD